jgi:hypothetical protein
VAYQSIFNSAGVISLPQIQAQFVPGQYGAINAQIAARQPVNPQSLGSTPARYNSIFNKPQSIAGRAESAINSTLLKPVTALGKSAYNIGQGAVGSISGNKVAVANANKQKAINEPQALAPIARPLIQTVRSIEHPFTSNTFTPTSPEAQRVFGSTPVQNIAAGVKSTAKQHGDLVAALYGAGQVGQDVATLAAIKGTAEGEGAVGATRNGIASAKQAFIDGPKQTLANSKAYVLQQAGEKANTPTKIPVTDETPGTTGVSVKTPIRPGIRQESTTTQIPVKTPVHAGIKDVSTTTKIGVRTPQQMTDEAFTKEFNGLSKAHDADTKKFEASAPRLAPQVAKAAGDKIDAYYQAKLNDLLDRYHNPKLSEPEKPTTLAKSITKAEKNTGGASLKAPKTVESSVSKAEKTTGGLQESPLTTAIRKARSQVITRPSALDKAELPEDTATVPKTAETAATKPTEATVKPTATKPTETAPKPETPKPTTPKTETTTPSEKVAGSSLRTQTKAVEAGMKSDEEATGATYKTVSHKAEAQKAVQLVQDNPDKAKDIAMGRVYGDNASHEAAVYHAVANNALAKAKETGDFSEVRELANSPRHTEVSEAAQKLSAEGYNVNPHDPTSIISDVQKSREKALGKSTSNTVAKETAKVGAEVKAATPRITRQSWSDFVDQLRC